MFGLQDFSNDIRRPVNSAADVDFQTRHNTSDGKFIRVGRLIIAVPFDETVPLLNTFHSQLIKRVVEDFSLFQHAIKESSDASSQGDIIDPRMRTTTGFAISDAGYIKIEEPQSERSNPLVVVHGESGDFGRADDAGRQFTLERLQQVLGANSDVILGDN